MILKVYDIETLCNCFLIVLKDVNTRKIKKFFIHESLNQYKDIINEIRQAQFNKETWIGFNNVAFDGQIITFMLEKYNLLKDLDANEITDIIYKKVQKIINIPDEERHKILKPEWELCIPQIDLYKQKNYHNRNKRTSLKWLQFTMRRGNIIEMPLPHNKPVNENSLQEILDYCISDVESTYDFYILNKYETELREVLSKEYRINLMNSSEPNLVKRIFGKLLSEDMGIEITKLRQMRTWRQAFYGRDVIFPYVTFENKELQDIFQQFKDVKINPNQTKDSFKLSTKVFGISTEMGLGGLHGCTNTGIYVSDDEYDIIDIDGTSYYPNLGIQNDLKPLHLGESFTKIYNSIFEKRKEIPKKDPRNYVFKIILNSAYGLSNEPNSFLLDSAYTLAITLNGQLLLMMLSEMLLKIPFLTLLQQNTDGITCRYLKKDKELIFEIMRKWTELTKINLEYVYYSKMIIYDVNNYFAVTTTGKVKRKGLFCQSMDFRNDQELDYHKNPSFLVIPKALNEYFLNGTDYKEYIKNHKDIYDFCGAIKVKRDFELKYCKLTNGRYSEENCQRVTRYFISNEHGTLIKKYTDGRRIMPHAQTNVSICNNINNNYNITDYNINYNFYILKCKEIIDEIEQNNKQILLF